MAARTHPPALVGHQLKACKIADFMPLSSDSYLRRDFRAMDIILVKPHHPAGWSRTSLSAMTRRTGQAGCLLRQLAKTHALPMATGNRLNVAQTEFSGTQFFSDRPL